jgi:hypothetical protein
MTRSGKMHRPAKRSDNGNGVSARSWLPPTGFQESLPILEQVAAAGGEAGGGVDNHAKVFELNSPKQLAIEL